MAVEEVKGFEHALAILVGLENQVVAWSHHDASLGVESGNVMGCPSNARCGVSASGLEQNLFGLELRQLLADDVGILLVSHQDDVLVGHNAGHAVDRHLQQATACTEKVQKLFGP